jgi:hypothetical protein
MFCPDKIGAVPLAVRTQDVSVPELPSGWFADGAAKTITVRQLTGNEVATAQEAAQTRDLRAALASAIEGGSTQEITAAAKAALGRGDAITPAYARKLETVRLGVVCDPPLDDAQVVEIGEHYAWVLERLYLAISTLTGKGADAAKKPAASTPTKGSKTP